MKCKKLVFFVFCVLSACLLNQCKTTEETTVSKKSQSIYKMLKLANFSEKTFDKLITNPKRGQTHFSNKKFDKKLLIKEHQSSGFKALTISQQNPTNVHLIFLHGGAYIAEATKGHRKLIEDICFLTNCKVTYIDYPLAPENSAIITHKILNEFYEILLDKYCDDEFILLGDSAGGGLALSFLQTLVDSNQKKIPKKTVLLSPWLDVEMKNPDIINYCEKDVVLNLDGLIQCGKIYAKNLPTNSPLVSPINGRFEELGEILIFVSTHELFYPDCTRLHELITQSDGSKSKIKIYEGMLHDWVIFPIEEREECIKEIVGFIEK